MQEILRILIPIVLAHILVLVAIIVVIKRLLLGDTTRAMDRISEVESEIRKKEEAIRREIEEHEKDFTRRKAEAEEELEKHRDEAEREVSKTRDQVISEARTESERIMDAARRNEQKLRDQIMVDMEEKGVDYGSQIFQFVFSDRLTEAIDKQFIGELLDALDEIDASSITVDSTEADFTFSHPIDADQKERLRKLVIEKFGEGVTISEKINPELLAGMIMKIGSLEIDGSLQNRYREAAAEVKKTVGHKS